jgi:hypothetical protein
MTMTTDARTTLDDWIPDLKIIEDCRRIVLGDGGGKIEYDRGPVLVPDKAEFRIASKAYLAPRIDIGFGECFRTLIAIGGIDSTNNGIVRAPYGFAVLWHKIDGSLITIDFTENCPM